jgi:type II secretory pathway pseudopilin PulG
LVVLIVATMVVVGVGAMVLATRAARIAQEKETTQRLGVIADAARKYFRANEASLPPATNAYQHGSLNIGVPVEAEAFNLEQVYRLDNWGRPVFYHAAAGITGDTVQGQAVAGYVLSYGPNQVLDSVVTDPSVPVAGGDDLLLALNVQEEGLEIAVDELQTISRSQCAWMKAGSDAVTAWNPAVTPNPFLVHFGLSQKFNLDPWGNAYEWDVDHFVSAGPGGGDEDNLLGPTLTSANCPYEEVTPPAAISFEDNFEGFDTAFVPVFGGATNITYTTSEADQEVNFHLGNSTMIGSERRAAIWYRNDNSGNRPDRCNGNGVCETGQGIRVYFEFKVSGTGFNLDGFTFAMLAARGANTALNLCGAGNEDLGFGGCNYNCNVGFNLLAMEPPKVAVEMDFQNGLYNDPSSNHAAVVYWGERTRYGSAYVTGGGYMCPESVFASFFDDLVHGWSPVGGGCAGATNQTSYNPAVGSLGVVVPAAEGLVGSWGDWLEDDAWHSCRIDISWAANTLTMKVWIDPPEKSTVYPDPKNTTIDYNDAVVCTVPGSRVCVNTGTQTFKITSAQSITYTGYQDRLDLMRFGWTLGAGNSSANGDLSLRAFRLDFVTP